MEVTVKLFTIYRQHLPPGAQGSSCILEVPPGTTAVELLLQLGVPLEEPVAAVILVNGRQSEPDRVLNDGDTVTAFPAVAGGQGVRAAMRGVGDFPEVAPLKRV